MHRTKLALLFGACIVLLSPGKAAAVLGAPTLAGPADNSTLGDFGPTLIWSNPAGTTQYHLQVIPANDDGPGVDVIRSVEQSFAIPAPPAWYGLLPGMTYTWRVRVSDASTSISPADSSWSPWASAKFRTPTVNSTQIFTVGPDNGVQVLTTTPLIRWDNRTKDVFYYELQLSNDASFNTDPSTATVMVYGALIHGGVTSPPNSYAVPAGFPLEADTPYYWRVRPRVQGDGLHLPWPKTSTFTTTTVLPTGSTWAIEGVQVTNASIGATGIIADVSTITLQDGRYRLLFEVNGSIRSAISSDGVTVKMEPGIRLARPTTGSDGEQYSPSLIRTLRLPDGRVRVYFGNAPGTSDAGICSAISIDEGLTWTIEPGLRIRAADLGVESVTGGSIVQVPDGRWRMYFSNTLRGPGPRQVFSATSTDLLSWTLDPSVRIGTAAALSGSAEHPAAFVNPDGSVTLFFFRNPQQLMAATSMDGLAFTVETPLGIVHGNDPDLVLLPDGSYRMYYNWGDDKVGVIMSARHAAGSLSLIPPAG